MLTAKLLYELREAIFREEIRQGNYTPEMFGPDPYAPIREMVDMAKKILPELEEGKPKENLKQTIKSIEGMMELTRNKTQEEIDADRTEQRYEWD